MNNKEQEIALMAYYKWEEAGRPEGRDKEFWEAAEAEYSCMILSGLKQ